MATTCPFNCIRPTREKAAKIAALPYDVYDRGEARAEVMREPESFLAIDRAETQFPDRVDPYAPEVYQKAHDLLWDRIAAGDFIQDETPCYYLYELTMDGHTQTGIVGCAAIDDYESGVIKKHENTRADKEEDRVRHVDICDAQTGPIFLAYRADKGLRDLMRRKKQDAPVYDFTAPDGVIHRVWVVDDAADIESITAAFAAMDALYIADGHHRAASAVRVGEMRRAAHPGYDGTEEYNFFLSVLFPDDELTILDYNRVVRDLNDLTPDAFLAKLSDIFDVTLLAGAERRPREKGTFTVYLAGVWYTCRVRPEDRTDDPVRGLDVSLLQDLFLGPILGITDPKTDPRIDFVGGIRGMDELERRCGSAGDVRAAFALYPTSIRELFAVADAGLLMPPKSTWFEPKLRSGLFIHSLR